MQKNHKLSKLEAAKIVVKNLKKNSIYYTAQDMSGVEGYEIGYIGGKSADAEARQMQYLDKNMGNVVDKKMGMKPVKDVEKVKKDSNKGGETNKTVKGVSLMSLVAKSVRGLQKMDATGEKIKKITMKEGMENDEVAFENLMKKYDWYAEMSDDSRKWDAQQDMERQLKQIAKTISAEKAVEIWNRYAPENNRKVDTSFFEMRENKVAKTIFDKNANITKGINNIAKGEDNKKKLKEYLKEMIRKQLKETFDGMEPMVRTGLDEAKLFADFSMESESDNSIKSRFARSMSEVAREYEHMDNIEISRFFDEYADGDDFYAGPTEALRFFQTLPNEFVVTNNIDGVDESFMITKTGDDSFTAEEI